MNLFERFGDMMRLLVCSLLAAYFAIPADTPVFQIWTGVESKAFATSLAPKMSAQKVATQLLANYGNHVLIVLHREGTGEAEFHKTQADTMVVQSGEASIIVGGTLVDAKPSGQNEIRGSSIQGGETRSLGPGDIVHIPSNTGHQVVVRDGKQITYAIIKVNGQVK